MAFGDAESGPREAGIERAAGAAVDTFLLGVRVLEAARETANVAKDAATIVGACAAEAARNVADKTGIRNIADTVATLARSAIVQNSRPPREDQ